MPGPRPIPNNVRRLRGQKERKSPKYVPMPPLTPPAWLDAVAKAEWRRVQKLTSHQGVITVVDRPALTGYVVAWSNLVAASKDVAKRGVMIPARSSADKAKGEDQALVKNPSLQVLRDSQATMKSWCRELGFTPAGRLGMDLPKAGVSARHRDLFGLGLVDDEDLD